MLSEAEMTPALHVPSNTMLEIWPLQELSHLPVKEIVVPVTVPDTEPEQVPKPLIAQSPLWQATPSLRPVPETMPFVTTKMRVTFPALLMPQGALRSEYVPTQVPVQASSDNCDWPLAARDKKVKAIAAAQINRRAHPDPCVDILMLDC